MIDALARALAARGYDTLTPVQEAVLAPDTAGADLLVSAQTGSGKTLAFGLAIAPTLMGDAPVFGPAGAPLGLVIAPTRELAMQVRRELAWLYAEAGAVLAQAVGGMDIRDERRALARGAHLVVATPGRLRDHLERGAIDLGALRAVVLDEADEMLDLGFREDLEWILGQAPAERQTLLFSATVPDAIARLAENYQRDARRIATATPERGHADIAYLAHDVGPRDAETAVVNVLRYHESAGAIVFCNTRAAVARMATRLSNRGFPVVALSGELSQAERTHALQAMRDGRARVCVATDVAARGIDLPNLDLVIHAELPTGADTLLHRSGRTGRAGRKGTSVLIVPPAVRTRARRLLGWAKVAAAWGPAPSADAVLARDGERLMADPALIEPMSETEAPDVARLVASFSPEALAAAVLRLWRNTRTAPEDIAEVGAGAPSAPAVRPEFGPSVWFAVGGGRDRDLDPRRLLPVLCRAGGVTRDEIGAIRIRPEESFVEISAASADSFEKAVGPVLELAGGLSMRRSDGPPPGAARGAPKGAGGPKPHHKGGGAAQRFEGPAPGHAPAGPKGAGKPKAHRKGPPRPDGPAGETPRGSKPRPPGAVVPRKPGPKRPGLPKGPKGRRQER